MTNDELIARMLGALDVAEYDPKAILHHETIETRTAIEGFLLSFKSRRLAGKEWIAPKEETL